MEDSESLSNSFPFSVIPLLMFHHPEFQTVANGLVDTINIKLRLSMDKVNKLTKLSPASNIKSCAKIYKWGKAVIYVIYVFSI